MNIRRMICVCMVMLVFQFTCGSALVPSKDGTSQVRFAAKQAAASAELPTEPIVQTSADPAELKPMIVLGAVLLLAAAAVILHLLRKKS